MKKTHYRVCHVCGGLNMKEKSLVKVCEHCHRQLPSFYFFDEERALGLKALTDQKTEDEHFRSTALPYAEYPPVFGLTAYWE